MDFSLTSASTWKDAATRQQQGTGSTETVGCGLSRNHTRISTVILLVRPRRGTPIMTRDEGGLVEEGLEEGASGETSAA